MTDFSEAEIHVGDVGTRFELTLEDGDGNAVDISSATTLQLVFRKPDGTVLEVTATLSGAGTDGKLYYDSVDGDIDLAGQWRVQAYVLMTGFEGHSGEKLFTVHKNLRTTWGESSSSSPSP